MFKVNAMGDYHDLYLKTDVLLLADVFEKFIGTCLEYYRLDPCHCFSSPRLNWDAMPKVTKVEFELIEDIGKHLFVQKEMKGGIFYIARRCSKENNKYMKSNDPDKPSNYITYLDVNNLYGQTMSKYFPYGVFKWLSQKEFDGFDVTQLVKIVLMGLY